MSDDYREYDDDPVHNSWVDYSYTQHTGERPYLYNNTHQSSPYVRPYTSTPSTHRNEIKQIKAKIAQLQASIDNYNQKISQLEQLRAKAPSAELANKYSSHIRNIRDMLCSAARSLEKQKQELAKHEHELSRQGNDAFVLYMIFVAAVIAFVIYLLF